MTSAVVAWVLLVGAAFDRFGYEINEFNTTVRVFARRGEWVARRFDANGIPLSYSTRLAPFVSPFYVVHYGLMYSDVTAGRAQRRGFHWRRDDSIRYWNVPPDVLSEQYFRAAADWVVRHLDRSTGATHLMYPFDWPYPQYPGGRLTRPWWSGLTDGYAILLLLRAHDVYGDERYISAAGELYQSTLAPVAEGGSLLQLNGHPWIEEYVDPDVDETHMSRVLNGMIYATYGIDAFERRTAVARRHAPRLYRAIEANLHVFDRAPWSDYDAIGTVANIKYHRIHVALMADLADITGSKRFARQEARWKAGVDHPGALWVMAPQWPVAKVHFVLTLFGVAFGVPGVLGACVIWLRRSRRKAGTPC